MNIINLVCINASIAITHSLNILYTITNNNVLLDNNNKEAFVFNNNNLKETIIIYNSQINNKTQIKCFKIYNYLIINNNNKYSVYANKINMVIAKIPFNNLFKIMEQQEQ